MEEGGETVQSPCNTHSGDAPPDKDYEPIQDGEADIATSIALAPMRVQAPGRKPFQKVWLRTASKSDGKKTASNEKYDKDKHGPEFGGTNALPGKYELVEAANTMEYLEVGLVIGNDPARYKPSGGRKKKEEMSVIDRDDNAMRAFIPTSANINPQARFYIGTSPVGGRLEPKVIAIKSIFFYEEFWSEATKKLPSRQREPRVTEACKRAAARVKDVVSRATTTITSADIEKWTSSNMLAVTQREHLASLIALQYTLYEHTADGHCLDAMIQVIENASPDLKLGPRLSNEGIATFWEFEKPLSAEIASRVAAELKTAHPNMKDLKPEIIVAVHTVLLDDDKLNSRLPYEHIAFSLEVCHQWIASADFHQDVMKAEVVKALDVTEAHSRHQRARTTSKDEPMDQDHFQRVLSNTIDIIHETREYLVKSANSLSQHHGGILHHKSIGEIMQKLSASVDISNASTLFEQLAALHAVLFSSSQREASDQLERLADMLKRSLKV